MGVIDYAVASGSSKTHIAKFALRAQFIPVGKIRFRGAERQLVGNLDEKWCLTSCKLQPICEDTTSSSHVIYCFRIRVQRLDNLIMWFVKHCDYIDLHNTTGLQDNPYCRYPTAYMIDQWWESYLTCLSSLQICLAQLQVHTLTWQLIRPRPAPKNVI